MTTSSGGPVNVTPDRLISFATEPGVASASTNVLSSPDAPTRYRFRINPDRLTIKHAKLEHYVLTKYGFERQPWGNDVSTFSYSGNSGVFRPETTVQEFMNRFPNGSYDIRKTTAWLRFQEFETFFRKTGSKNIFMYYNAYGHEWEGSLPEFSFDRTANAPFHITYNFTFKALPIDYPQVSVDDGVTDADSPAVQRRQASNTGGLGVAP